jgi:hypothetical protein
VSAIVFLAVVPVWPYQPHCGTYGTADFQTVEGELTPDFLAAMEVALSDHQVYYWQLGDRIYVRFLMGLLPEGISINPGGSGVLDAQLQAVAGLVSPRSIHSWVGEELNGRIYAPPTYLTKLYERDHSLVFGRDCTFIRAVAFGERPPAGYEPEPPLLERAPKASP